MWHCNRFTSDIFTGLIMNSSAPSLRQLPFTNNNIVRMSLILVSHVNNTKTTTGQPANTAISASI
jgi:hypothetical protein